VATVPENRCAALDEAIILALGGNLTGDYPSVEALLEAALSGFLWAGLTVARRSGWWRSAAWPDPSAPAYLNGVAIVETKLSPRALLAQILALEATFGRSRAEPNAPRTLDLDLIAYGRRVSPGSPVLPHPRASQRRFVMGPLAELLPDWTDPLSGEAAQVLADRAPVGKDATPVG